MCELNSRGVCVEDFLGIEGFDIYWYGVIIAAGFLLAYFICSHLAKKCGFPGDMTTDILIISIICACIGSRLYYVAFSWDSYFVPGDFAETLKNICDIRSGGLAIYGGVFGAIAGLCVYAKIKKYSIPQMLDLCAAPLALGQAMGRWGNFFNQEAHGALVTDERLQFFPYAVYFDSPKDATVPGWYQATFFYESVWCLVIFVTLLVIFGRQKYKGQLVLTYFAMYGLERGIVEWLRTDSLQIGALPVSALLSIILCACSVAALTILKIKKFTTPLEYTLPEKPEENGQ